METPEFESIDFGKKYEEGKFSLAWKLCVLLASLFGLMSIIEFFHSITNSILYLFCAFIPGLCLLYLHSTRNSWYAYFGLCLFGCGMTLFSLSSFPQEVHFGDFLWMALITIMAFWGMGNFWGWLFGIANFLIIVLYLMVFMENNFEQMRPVNTSLKLSLMVEMFAAFSSIGMIVSQFVKYFRYSFESLLDSNKQTRESNRIIRQKNEENVLLIKEVHHRVKNNLQIITSLLRLQKHSVPDEAKPQFEEAIDRIMSMALIHRRLYQSGEFTNIDIRSYIHDLIGEIMKSQDTQKEINFGVRTDGSSIGLNTIVPVGLIINELVSNSFKHAFDKVESGMVSVQITRSEKGKISMVYSDNGEWKASDPSDAHFGLELIATLTEQLEGQMEREGSMFRFVFIDQDESA